MPHPTPAPPAGTPGCGNVFADLGLPQPEVRLLKAELALALSGELKRQRRTQTATAELLDLTQPEVSRLTRGRLAGFSLERLVTCLAKLGKAVRLQVVDVADRPTATGRREKPHAG